MRACISHREARFVSRFAITRLPLRIDGLYARLSLGQQIAKPVAHWFASRSPGRNSASIYISRHVHLRHLQQIDLCNPSTILDWCWQGCLEAWDSAQQKTASFEASQTSSALERRAVPASGGTLRSGEDSASRSRRTSAKTIACFKNLHSSIRMNPSDRDEVKYSRRVHPLWAVESFLIIIAKLQEKVGDKSRPLPTQVGIAHHLPTIQPTSQNHLLSIEPLSNTSQHTSDTHILVVEILPHITILNHV